MRTNKLVHVVGCHAGGEVGDVIVAGVGPLPGESLWEQSRLLERESSLKDYLLNEPRGGVFRHINLLVPPKNPRADIGYIILEPETVPPMSGSNTICVATVVLETGILPMTEPETCFLAETPGGLIEIRAACRDGKVESVQFTNIHSFAERLDAPLEIPGRGTLSVDILFGGDSFVAVDATLLGFDIVPEEARELVEIGMKIANAADEQVGFKHPTLEGMNNITFCVITKPVEESEGKLVTKHCVSVRPGKIDRSPTGTAVSARLAQLHARGQASVGSEITFRSILGSEFIGRIESETEFAGRRAIRPSVRGRAWIMDTRQLMLDPTDPWPTGYRLGDTWPNIK